MMHFQILNKVVSGNIRTEEVTVRKSISPSEVCFSCHHDGAGGRDAGGGQPAGGRGGGRRGAAGGVRHVVTPREQDHAAAGPGTRHVPDQWGVLGLHLRGPVQSEYELWTHSMRDSHCFLPQDSPVMFGMRVLHCQEPPGLELFGHAPQFNANNFSHVFKHGSRWSRTCSYAPSVDWISGTRFPECFSIRRPWTWTARVFPSFPWCPATCRGSTSTSWSRWSRCPAARRSTAGWRSRPASTLAWWTMRWCGGCTGTRCVWSTSPSSTTRRSRCRSARRPTPPRCWWARCATSTRLASAGSTWPACR